MMNSLAILPKKIYQLTNIASQECLNEVKSSGRSYNQVSISIENCVFTRLNKYSGSGGVIYASGSGYNMSASFSMIINCTATGIGGAIFFNSQASILKTICVFRCHSDNMCHFAQVSTVQENEASFLSMSYCSYQILKPHPMEMIYGNQITNNLNSSLNFNTWGSGFYSLSSLSYESSFCIFSNNYAQQYTCLYINNLTGTMSSAIFVHNNSPSTNGLINSVRNARFSMNYCIFDDNEGVLFSPQTGGAIELAHCYIYHEGSFETKSIVTTANNNSLQKRQTYEVGLFGSQYCNADNPIPVPSPLASLTIRPSPIETPESTPKISDDPTPVETPYQTEENSPVETPMSTYEMTEIVPETTPIHSPVVTYDYTPIQTPILTPLETLLDTIAMSPLATLYETLIETPFQTYEPTQDSTPLQSPLQTPFHTPVFSPMYSPLKTLQPTHVPTTIPPTPDPIDSLCVGGSSQDVLICPNGIARITQNQLSNQLEIIKNISITNTVKILIVGTPQIVLSFSTLKNKIVSIEGFTQGSSVLLDFIEAPSSLEIYNIDFMVKNSSLLDQSDLVLTIDSINLRKISNISLFESISDWNLTCNEVIADFESFGSLSNVKIESKLSIIEGNPTTTSYPNVEYSSNAQLIISTFFTDIKAVVGGLFIGIGNNQYINVFGSPKTYFSGHQKLNISGSNQIQSIKTNQFLPKISFNMADNSVISFSGSFPQVNGEDPFSLSSNGLCSLMMTNQSPIQYSVGSMFQIGFETAKFVDFGKILDANLTISTEAEGSVRSITFIDSGIVIKNTNNETISVPISSDIIGGLTIVNENKVQALVIDINVSNSSEVYIAPVPIVLTEKSKTLISESFSNVTIPNNITIQTSTTNVEVILSGGSSSGNLNIVGSNGVAIPINQLYIKPDPTTSINNNDENSSSSAAIIVIGSITIIGLIVAIFLYMKYHDTETNSSEPLPA